MVTQITNSILKKVYQKRKPWVHKGDFGRLLVIGGSRKYSGSPAFNSLAALKAMSTYRTGTDVVEVISPRRAADIIASFSPDIITIPLDGDYIEKKHLSILLKESKNKSAFVIGGGIERNKKTLSVVKNYLKKIKIPGVIDAGAIYALQNKNNKINLSNFIITPHSYEFFILTGKKPNENLKQRINLVKQEAKKLNTTILLKGHIDIISNGKQTAINKTGTPYMTKGGTGDTLAGITGSLIAQGNSLFLSACAAAYINGKAGELTKRKNSLVASDLLEKIGKIVDKV